MTKPVRRILTAVLLALCLAATCGLCVACNDDVAEEVTYTVTVKADENTPASGVKVKIMKSGIRYGEVTTGPDGNASFSLVPDSYTVELASLPEHRAIPDDADLTLTADKHELTVVLVQAFAYEVDLVKADGSAFTADGVQVGICTLSGNCLAPVALGTDGKAFIEAAKGDYHVQILGLNGYAYECDENGYYTGKNFSETVTVMEITLYPVTEILSGTAMDTAAKTAFAALSTIHGFDTTAPAYEFTKEIAAGAKEYIAIRPDITGTYTFYHTDVSDNMAYYLGGTTFSLIPEETDLMPSYAILEEGKTYYITIANEDIAAATARFVISAPVSSHVEYDGTANSLNLTIGSALHNAVIEVKTLSDGAFKLTTQGETLAYVQSGVYVSDTLNSNNLPADSDYKKANTAVVSIINGKTAYIGVHVKADEYPVNVSVKLERIASASEVFAYAEVKSNLTQFTKPANKELVGIPMTEETVLTKENDGTYTYNGKQVVVLITGDMDYDRFGNEHALAYMEIPPEMNQLFPATYEVDNTPDGAEYTSILNYEKFIRGFIFDEYDVTLSNFSTKYEVPDASEITTEKYYAKYVNEDGAYPLTEELKVFLEKFYEANANTFSYQLPWDVEETYGWMFPLYYYDDSTGGGDDEDETDAVVGIFVNSDEEAITSIVLTVNKNNTFTVVEESDMGTTEWASGTWEKSGSNYTFSSQSCTLTYSVDNDEFTYSDDFTTNMTFIRFVDPIVAEYTYSHPMTGTTITFTVNADGTFSLNNGRATETGTWEKTDELATLAEYSFTTEWSDYTVTRNLLSGEIIMYEDDGFEYLRFNSPVYSLKAADNVTLLFLYGDETFELYIYYNASNSYALYTSGTYTFDPEFSMTASPLPYDVASIVASEESEVITVTITYTPDEMDPDDVRDPLVYTFDMSEGNDEVL